MLRYALLSLLLVLVGSPASANGDGTPHPIPTISARAWCELSPENIEAISEVHRNWSMERYAELMLDQQVRCIDLRLTVLLTGSGQRATYARGIDLKRRAREDLQLPDGGPCYSYPVFRLPVLGDVFSWEPCKRSEGTIKGRSI